MIGLIDYDGKITNLALMKLSTHYKAQGEQVEFARVHRLQAANVRGLPDHRLREPDERAVEGVPVGAPGGKAAGSPGAVRPAQDEEHEAGNQIAPASPPTGIRMCWPITWAKSAM
jgi:hypothetical protein